jgi:glycosyltransferase involved in cell wall biosynthesis
LRIDYYSPLPPERSGVADYSALLLPALRARFDLDVRRRRRSARSHRGDLALYQIGNDARRHGWIVHALRRRPGVVVLHEVGIHELVASLTLGRGDRTAYLDAVEWDGGRKARLRAHAWLAGLLPPLWETRPLEAPLLDGILDRAVGVIVHSRFAADVVRGKGYEGPVWSVPFPGYPVPEVDAAPIGRGRFPVVSSLGAMTGSKRIPQLLRAFARLRLAYPDALLVLAGAGEHGVQLDARLENLGLKAGRDVLALGHVRDADFWALIARSDVSVSLRWPTLGETSASVIRALALGRPVVVSDVGWYAELPDAVAVKVRLDDREVDSLMATLEVLAGNERLRESLGATAAGYVANKHHVDRTADAYTAALREAVRGGLAIDGHDAAA